ncbi:hypothetical protein K443DRAFT_677919 [Laccaria amethystina LaAM-08-1]|uniref:Uncharacterized protein n=1 Tax=Laccaria amethystina LaAM-08-1 TaxID=1095629 RepID=A0A0C9WT04_9AGAR|nr:hypothetical protein K443DRAFT_677919 [Laccaria amethystina LaAM-08-1]
MIPITLRSLPVATSLSSSFDPAPPRDVLTTVFAMLSSSPSDPATTYVRSHLASLSRFMRVGAQKLVV